MIGDFFLKFFLGVVKLFLKFANFVLDYMLEIVVIIGLLWLGSWFYDKYRGRR